MKTSHDPVTRRVPKTDRNKRTVKLNRKSVIFLWVFCEKNIQNTHENLFNLTDHFFLCTVNNISGFLPVVIACWNVWYLYCGVEISRMFGSVIQISMYILISRTDTSVSLGTLTPSRTIFIKTQLFRCYSPVRGCNSAVHSSFQPRLLAQLLRQASYLIVHYVLIF